MFGRQMGIVIVVVLYEKLYFYKKIITNFVYI